MLVYWLECVSAVLTCYDIILLYVHSSRTVSVQSDSHSGTAEQL